MSFKVLHEASITRHNPDNSKRSFPTRRPFFKLTTSSPQWQNHFPYSISHSKFFLHNTFVVCLGYLYLLLLYFLQCFESAFRGFVYLVHHLLGIFLSRQIILPGSPQILEAYIYGQHCFLSIYKLKQGYLCSSVL
jgi:hypothetical protein